MENQLILYLLDMRKRILLLAFSIIIISCSKEEKLDITIEEAAETQYVLGKDDLALVLEGKTYKFVFTVEFGRKTIRIIQFGEDGKRNVTTFCGADGNGCGLDERGGCYMTCDSYSTATILLQSSGLIEYGDGSRITFRGGKLYIRAANAQSEYELIESSEEELKSLKAEVVYQCDSSLRC